MDGWNFEFDPEKNAWLIRARGISFEQIIARIEEGHLVGGVSHPNVDRYPDQLLFEVDMGEYIYVMPVVITGRTIFCKTAYPSRQATRKHRKGGVT